METLKKQNHRILQGVIVSNRMAKTVVVRIDRLRKHPKYQKYERTSRRFKAHADDAQSFAIGDVVLIEESRPLSKEKRWKVVSMVRKAAGNPDEMEIIPETVESI